MSTDTQSPIHIPSDDAVATPTGQREIWRIADGQLLTGSEREGTLRSREKVTGLLRRIGIHFGTTKDTGESYGQLEADVETADGVVRVKTGITEKGTGALKPSVAALTFAGGLLDMARDELIIVTANAGTKVNKFGKTSTYANLYHLDGATLRTREAARRPRDPRPMDEQWEALAAELRTHPAYAERPARETDDEAGNPTTHLADLCRTCAERGWPTPEQAPVEWLALAARAFKQAAPKAGLRDHDDHEWGRIHQAVLDLSALPAALAAAAARIGGPAQAPQATLAADAFA